MVEGESSKNPKKSNGKRKFKGKDDKSYNKKAKLVCRNRKKPGHFKKDCRLRKVNKDGAGPTFYVQGDNVAWWVDSGATSHVCKELYWFKDFQPIEDGSIVKMGNVAIEPIKGLGSVLPTFTSGKCLCLNNVLYVPTICKNLVFEIVLNNYGYKQVLESDKLNINYPSINNYVCLTSTSTSNNFNKYELWHARLGHIQYKRFKDMSKMSLIPAFDMKNNENIEHAC
uniref:GAG-pre-integrase domain-containing protein n=1 Tax=Lactuca sativa TaxID=4236 RepID=A0A9R1WBX1_LACSA|nr:hypothetical protein LSAT_V11C300133250 [Lactuca sativa]